MAAASSRLESIWESRQVTNRGPQARAFESALAEFLGVEHVTLCCNGTIGLLCALRSLGLPPGSEVITTPYSFVATASAIVWVGCKPVFVDIDDDTFNIDPAAVAAAITPATSAILPVHCYGRPADVDGIRSVADAHGLPVVYDAAHAFGADCHCGDLLGHGDASVISFHGTKIFNTFEGGCVISPDAEAKTRIDRLINFGFVDEITVAGVGINGKLNEFSAAIGRLQLRDVNAAISRCRDIAAIYEDRLRLLEGVRLPPFAGYRPNYSYYPIRVTGDAPKSRDAVYRDLRDRNIFARRYFYPLISDFPDYSGFHQAGGLSRARSAAAEVLCLPIYSALADDELARVCDAVIESLTVG